MPPIKHTARLLAFPLLFATVAAVAVVATALEGPGDPPPAEGGLVGAQTCKTCHNAVEKERRWDTWRNTKHADALETLKSAASAAIAKERKLDKPAWESPACLQCHVTAYDTAKAAAPARINHADAIQCETCHGPGADHVRDAQMKWVEKVETVDVAAHIDYPDQSNCLQCHNTESPTWDPTRYTLPDGTTTGFDYKQAKQRAIHPEADARPLSNPTTPR